MYKKTTIYRRIERRMGLHQIDKISHYLHFLQENPQEEEALSVAQRQMNRWPAIHITTQLGPALPPYWCNRDQVIQALLNLLANACDAAPDGGQVAIRTQYKAQDHQQLLQVSDSGR